MDRAGTRGGPRSRLSRERVLEAAVALADRDGIEALTMRRLADELGAGAMSLYHYMPTKDVLVDAMIDVVFGEIERPTREGDWRDAMRRRAASTRAALRRHPWAIGLMEARGQPGPANLHLHDAVLGCLRNAGFSVAGAVRAYSVQDAYIYGFALQERSLGFETAAEAAVVGARMVEQFRHLADELPHSYEVVAGHVAQGRYDPTEEFEQGLELILDGLERLRGSGAAADGARA